jgi:thiol-disulfide isomerase/thioredoxin
LNRHAKLHGLLVATIVIAAACSSSGGAEPTASASPMASAPPPSVEPAATPSAPVAGSPTPPTTPAATDSPAAVVLDQPWATAELTDVTTGDTFRIADLAGRTVILETMAIWCTNCRAQQREVYEALEQLDPERVAYVLLDVDPSESGPALATYRERNEFSGVYAIAGTKTARALADEFGDQVLNPPATPIIFIGSDGRVTLTDYGPKSVDTLVALAREHGA